MNNEFLTDEYTSTIQKLIQEVQNDPSTYLGAKYIPQVEMPVSRIQCEILEATGGLTSEYALGTDPGYIQRAGSRVQEFAPPSYRETILFDEKDILHLRQMGQNDRAKRGIRSYLDKAMDRLSRRLEARIEYQRWQAIFTGAFSWMGETFSYGIPSGNVALPLAGLWSLDGINANNAVNPIADIRYWTGGGLARFRKYKIKRMIMNPNTARWVLENSNTKAYLSSIGANPNISEWTLPKLIAFLIPGGPEVVIYDGWYQQETVTAGKISVGDAIYFIPDGKIFFEATLPDGDMIGEFVMGLHMAGGSIDSPAMGKFLVVEECIAPGTRGGPKNPFMEATAGVNGGVNLQRSFDVLTASVGP